MYRIGGYDNHIHLLNLLHPTITLSILVIDIKLSSSLFIGKKKLCPIFKGCGKGYAAFRYIPEALSNLIDYIKNQDKHHEKENSFEELKRLLREFDVEFEEKYLK